MSSEYTVQTAKIMKTENGKVTLNKQYAFDYDGKNANIVLKNNKDFHEYKLSNKNINDMFTKIMQNKDISLKERLKIMINNEKNKKQKAKKSTTKKAKQNTTKKAKQNTTKKAKKGTTKKAKKKGKQNTTKKGKKGKK
tara:strand:- start:5526 stop:5939 length:414 start_codon:yes stop_codon:yes gene_type:complete